VAILISYPNIFDWDAHKQAGRNGGDDFRVPRGDPVYAPVAGRARVVGETVTIAQADGWLTQVLHLTVIPIGLNNKQVTTGTIIGYASTHLSPHIHDINPSGVRVRNRQVISSLAPAGGGSTPIGFLMALTDDEQRAMFEALVQPYGYVPPAIINVIRGEVLPEFAVPGQGYKWFPALNNKLEAIIAALGTAGMSVNLDSLAEQLSADIETNAKARQAELLAAIAGVDEETLATFGLKRA
jgi:hypothetical protein